MHCMGKVDDLQQGVQAITQRLEDGSALEKFKAMIIGQGVTSDDAAQLCDHRSILPRATYTTSLHANSSGEWIPW